MHAKHLTSEQQDHFYAVIMAGGGGTRLWPWSRKEQTKQMLRIVGDRSMFQITIDRILDLIKTDNMYVVTTAEQAAKLEAQTSQIPHDNYIIEPMPKGTASVIGLAAAHILARDPDGVMAVLTADHYIRDISYFNRLLETAYAEAEKKHLVTLGIEPTFPSTGMGYIEQGEFLESVNDDPVYKVSRFCEKPDKSTAEQFLASGNYAWNSGMFIWRADRIMEEIRKYLPDLYEKLMPISQSVGSAEYEEKMQKIWPEIKPQTIDFGVMEKADDVAVLPAKGLGWNDIGSWESLFDVLDSDENGNICINCRTIQLDSNGVLSCSEKKDKMIITVGMKDVVVVETDSAVLVCPRKDTQRIKEIVQILKDKEMDMYL